MEIKNTTELITLVKKEAKALKKNAKKYELSYLNFKNFRPENTNECIYGQMTGNCYSSRAIELIQKCADRVYKQKMSEDLYLCKLNGKPEFDTEFGDRNGDYFSPIECFITNPRNEENGNNLALINYLKGNKKTLILKK